MKTRLFVCAVLGWSTFASAQIAMPKVPAKTIDASKFSSLQAAFDALPETGGVVLIPPGDCEITEPLRSGPMVYLSAF